MKKILQKLTLIFLTLMLVACGITGSKKRIPYKKPPVNVTIGAGPNRVFAVEAMKYLGVPYYFGGSSPAQGFDCSGLIQYSAKRSLGLNLPRTTSQQSQFGEKIRIADLKAGDIVFFNTTGQPNSHAGIYLGDTFFVHAPSSGGVVRVDSYTNPYWQTRINSARRIRE